MVKCLGEERQLFATRQTTDGSILFMFKTELSTMVDKMVQQVKDLHITAHTMRPIEGRDCYKMKFSLLNIERDIFDRSHIVKDRKNRGLVWPLISVFSAAPIGKSFDFSKKSGDKIIPLIGFMGVGESLNYTIFMSTPNLELPRVQGFGMHVERFSALTVTIYYGFFHMTSPSFSIFKPFRQGPIRKNGVLEGTGAQGLVVETLTPQATERYLQRVHIELAANYLSRESGDSAISSELKGRFEVPTFGRWPRENDEIHEAYGLGSQLTNPVYTAPFFLDGAKKPHGWIEPLDAIATHRNTPEALKAAGIISRFGIDADE